MLTQVEVSVGRWIKLDDIDSYQSRAIFI